MSPGSGRARQQCQRIAMPPGIGQFADRGDQRLWSRLRGCFARSRRSPSASPSQTAPSGHSVGRFGRCRRIVVRAHGQGRRCQQKAQGWRQEGGSHGSRLSRFGVMRVQGWGAGRGWQMKVS